MRQKHLFGRKRFIAQESIDAHSCYSPVNDEHHEIDPAMSIYVQTIHAAILIPCGLPDAYVRQSAIRELATV
ncbi:MAG: hypothetical protein ACXW3N_07535 [Rhodoplanes sp.]|jgi:hypothetical protein